MKTESFADDEIRSIKLRNIEASISFEASSNGRIEIAADGPDSFLKGLSIDRAGGVVSVTSDEPNGCVPQSGIGMRIASGIFGTTRTRTMVVTNGSGTTVITGDGNIFVNGARIGSDAATEQDKPRIVTIRTTRPIDVEAHLEGAASLRSATALGNVTLDLSGSASFDLGATKNFKLDASGACRGRAAGIAGLLAVDISGAGGGRFSGAFTDVKVDVSGAGDVTIDGDASGSLDIDASGACSIAHTGKIAGKVRQRSTGAARIRIG